MLCEIAQFQDYSMAVLKLATVFCVCLVERYAILNGKLLVVAVGSKITSREPQMENIAL